MVYHCQELHLKHVLKINKFHQKKMNNLEEKAKEYYEKVISDTDDINDSRV